MTWVFRLSSFLFIITFFFFSCSGQGKKDSVPLSPLASAELVVAPQLQADFVPIQKSRYSAAEIAPLFQLMDEKGDAYCEIHWSKKSYSKSTALEFINEKSLPAYRYSHPRSVYGISSGCHNFFKMNDRRPDRTFQLVKKLFPGKKYDCYSVGFLQPYMLHNELSCERLTMLDIDWRIEAGHHALLSLYDAREFSDPALLESALGKLNLPWVALLGFNVTGEKMDAEKPGALDELCPDSQQENCKTHILEFQKNYLSLQKIRFDLSALHETDFLPVSENMVRVFFLSNAIEDLYTTPKQYKELLTNLRNTSKPGEQTIFIHQAGSRQNFGLYEYQVVVDSSGNKRDKVRTICRDVYPNTRLNRESDVYDIYFDETTVTRHPPACSWIYKQKVENN